MMDRSDPRIYIRVLLHVRGQITSGVLHPGQPTQTITSLCRDFGCTRETAAKALRLLMEEGILHLYPGLGYYVSHDCQEYA